MQSVTSSTTSSIDQLAKLNAKLYIVNISATNKYLDSSFDLTDHAEKAVTDEKILHHTLKLLKTSAIENLSDARKIAHPLFQNTRDFYRKDIRSKAVDALFKEFSSLCTLLKTERNDVVCMALLCTLTIPKNNENITISSLIKKDSKQLSQVEIEHICKFINSKYIELVSFALFRKLELIWEQLVAVKNKLELMGVIFRTNGSFASSIEFNDNFYQEELEYNEEAFSLMCSCIKCLREIDSNDLEISSKKVTSLVSELCAYVLNRGKGWKFLKLYEEAFHYYECKVQYDKVLSSGEFDMVIEAAQMLWSTADVAYNQILINECKSLRQLCSILKRHDHIWHYRGALSDDSRSLKGELHQDKNSFKSVINTIRGQDQFSGLLKTNTKQKSKFFAVVYNLFNAFHPNIHDNDLVFQSCLKIVQSHFPKSSRSKLFDIQRKIAIGRYTTFPQLQSYEKVVQEITNLVAEDPLKDLGLFKKIKKQLTQELDKSSNALRIMSNPFQFEVSSSAMMHTLESSFSSLSIGQAQPFNFTFPHQEIDSSSNIIMNSFSGIFGHTESQVELSHAEVNSAEIDCNPNSTAQNMKQEIDILAVSQNQEDAVSTKDEPKEVSNEVKSVTKVRYSIHVWRWYRLNPFKDDPRYSHITLPKEKDRIRFIHNVGGEALDRIVAARPHHYIYTDSKTNINYKAYSFDAKIIFADKTTMTGKFSYGFSMNTHVLCHKVFDEVRRVAIWKEYAVKGKVEGSFAEDLEADNPTQQEIVEDDEKINLPKIVEDSVEVWDSRNKVFVHLYFR